MILSDREIRAALARDSQLIFEIVDGTPDKGYEGRFAIQGPEAAPPRRRQPPQRKRRAP